jgi:hypothetical protein
VSGFVIACLFAQLIKRSKEETQDLNAMETFFSELEHSPETEEFSVDEVKEKLKSTNVFFIKSIYNSILNELWYNENEIYCKNLRFILIEMNQEIADRKIGAHQYSKRKKDVNYAREYASSLNFPLYNHNLSDEEALLAVNKFSDAELVFIILDTNKEIMATTSEHTFGREEEMEACYHNNLRRIEFLLRKELAKRFFASAE